MSAPPPAAARRGLYLLAACCAALLIAACGSGGHEGGHLDFRGHNHPDIAQSLSVAVSNDQVIVSPDHVGAGQFIVSVVNSAPHALKVMLVADSGKLRGKVIMNTGKVAAGESAQVKTGVAPGRYRITTAGTAAPGALIIGAAPTPKPATLEVGPVRNGQDVVQEP